MRQASDENSIPQPADIAGELSLEALAAETAAQRASARRLRTAVGRAHLPDRAFYVFTAGLLPLATAKGPIAPTFRQLQDRLNGMDSATLARSLDHLERHGWITRTRDGRKVTYQLQTGEVCECRPGRGQPMTGAERKRKQRAKARQAEDVTLTASKPDWLVTLTASEERNLIQTRDVTLTASEMSRSAGAITMSRSLQRHDSERDKPQVKPRFDAIGSDLHPEQVLTTPVPAENDTPAAAENPALDLELPQPENHPNLTAADPCPGQVQSSGFGLTGSGSDKTLGQQVRGGAGPVLPSGSSTSENRGGTAPKYMGNTTGNAPGIVDMETRRALRVITGILGPVEVVESWPAGSAGEWANR